MMKENMGLCVFIATALFFASFFQDVASFPMQESNEASLNQPNSEINIKDSSYIPASNLDARMRLYLLSWLQNIGSLPNGRVKAKRTCRLNAGLSHSCDYKDTLDAIHEGMYLGSDMTPGKK